MFLLFGRYLHGKIDDKNDNRDNRDNWLRIETKASH